MKFKFLVITTVLILSASIFGQTNPAQTDVDNMCNVSAYITDQDPKGLNVRSKPDSKSKAVGTIPFNSDGTVVDIIGAKGSWVKIENAYTADESSVFSKTGWVYAPLLAVSVSRRDGKNQPVSAYKTPYLNAEIAASLPLFKEYKVAGCHDGFVKITIPQSKGNILGWLDMENTCDSPWTSCS